MAIQFDRELYLAVREAWNRTGDGITYASVADECGITEDDCHKIVAEFRRHGKYMKDRRGRKGDPAKTDFFAQLVD